MGVGTLLALGATMAALGRKWIAILTVSGVIERLLSERADIHGARRMKLGSYQRDVQHSERFWGPCYRT